MSEKRTPEAAKKAAQEIDLVRILATFWDFRWLIVGATSLFTVVGVMYALFSTPVYQADALVQVEQNVGSSLLNDISSMLPASQSASATEIELIQSRMVLGKTIDDLNLTTDIQQKYFPIFGKGWSRLTKEIPAAIALSRLTVPKSWVENDIAIELTVLNDSSYEVTENGNLILKGNVGKLASKGGVSLLVSSIDAKPGSVFTILQRSKLEVIEELNKKLTVADKGRDTGVLSISLTGENPVLIREIVDSISKNYLNQNVERKSEEAGKSLDFLKEQLPQVRADLDAAENKLNGFRQKNDSVDLSLEAKSVLDSMVSIDTQLNESTFKEAEISKLYTKEHPAYRALLEKRKTLQEEKEKLNKRIGSMPKTQQEILRLTRDVKSGQEVYMQLLNKQQELSINKASTVGNVRIIDQAVTSPKPVKPKKVIIIILSFIIGAGISCFYVLLRVAFHKGIESPDEIEELGLSVYSSIPISEWQQKKVLLNLPNSKKKIKSNNTGMLLAQGNPADLAMEAIRNLRTSLHFAMLDAKNNVFIISGPSPAIGKSFVSTNLAAAIAQSGQKVIYIDGDMRRGYAHKLLGTADAGQQGLSTILSGQASVENVVRNSIVPGLDYIARGEVPPNPSELLLHSNFEKLVHWARENYDTVLIDTPPILAVTDAAIIAKHAGSTLMVARFDITTAKEIEISAKRFEQNGINIKGVILNAVTKKTSAEYSYGYYQYEYKSEK
ncbi:tyrosine-protein kinase Wzc [Serratia fonticola]|uniref:tyrosine-protein kinase Wzc n=1 Tax=Serratia fonticola TaxID=47917 RepID=UPI00301E56DA